MPHARARADQDSVQMLQRAVQVGEFYRMSPPMIFSEKLPPTYMDITCADTPRIPIRIHASVPCPSRFLRVQDLRRGVGPTRAYPI